MLDVRSVQQDMEPLQPLTTPTMPACQYNYSLTYFCYTKKRGCSIYWPDF